MFQSTLPHRERLVITVTLGQVVRFQSTLPHRERRILGHSDITTTRFQSTLPHRERPQLHAVSGSEQSFNPRSHIGSDGDWVTRDDVKEGFNPRSHIGSDRR